MDLLGLGDVLSFDLATAWRPRPARDRLRVPIGVGDGGGLGLPRHQGVRPAGHGPARPGDRRDRLRQVGVPPHAGARPGDDALVRAAQHGARRLQGRRDLRRHGRDAARLGRDHQPRRASSPSSTACRTRCPARWCAARSCCARPATTRRCATTRRPAPPASRSSRCRRLFIVVDEFSEMLSAKPEFIDLFVAIGRLGRSLGLHLLLASQRLEEGRLRGLESPPVLPHRPAHVLAARVAGRPRRAGRLRAAAVPGLGYLKPDQSTLLRFKAAYVSGPPSMAGERQRASTRSAHRGRQAAVGRGRLPRRAACRRWPRYLADSATGRAAWKRC